MSRPSVMNCGKRRHRPVLNFQIRKIVVLIVVEHPHRCQADGVQLGWSPVAVECFLSAGFPDALLGGWIYRDCVSGHLLSAQTGVQYPGQMEEVVERTWRQGEMPALCPDHSVRTWSHTTITNQQPHILLSVASPSAYLRFHILILERLVTYIDRQPSAARTAAMNRLDVLQCGCSAATCSRSVGNRVVMWLTESTNGHGELQMPSAPPRTWPLS